MNKLVSFLEEKVSPIAGRIGSQRHMVAIRKGIIATLPLTIVGSFFTILLNIPIDSVAAKMAPYLPILDIPFRFTVGILALYATFGIAYSLAESYKLDGLTSGMLATMAFIITSVQPVRVMEDVDNVITAGRWMNIANLSSASLFGSIVTAILSVEIYRFMKEKKFQLRCLKVYHLKYQTLSSLYSQRLSLFYSSGELNIYYTLILILFLVTF